MYAIRSYYAMGGEEVVAHVRVKFRGDESAGRRNEAVDHHRDADGGTADDQAGDAADLEAADLGQHIDRVLGVWGVDAQPLLDDADLVGEGRIVDPRAAVGDLGDRKAGEEGGDGGRRGGVADPSYNFV